LRARCGVRTTTAMGRRAKSSVTVVEETAVRAMSVRRAGRERRRMEARARAA
jgi:hypothetical protein